MSLLPVLTTELSLSSSSFALSSLARPSRRSSVVASSLVLLNTLQTPKLVASDNDGIVAKWNNQLRLPSLFFFSSLSLLPLQRQLGLDGWMDGWMNVPSLPFCRLVLFWRACFPNHPEGLGDRDKSVAAAVCTAMRVPLACESFTPEKPNALNICEHARELGGLFLNSVTLVRSYGYPNGKTLPPEGHPCFDKVNLPKRD